MLIACMRRGTATEVSFGRCSADTFLSSSLRREAGAQDAAVCAARHAVCGDRAAQRRASRLPYSIPMLEEPGPAVCRALETASPKHRRHLRRRLQLSFEDVPVRACGKLRGRLPLPRARQAQSWSRMAPTATDNPRLFLENGFDYVLCGEAEQTLAQLCSAILRGSPTMPRHRWAGSARCADGHRSTVRRGSPGIQHGLTLPAASRDLIDLEPYRAGMDEGTRLFLGQYGSSRGCPYRCNWCAKPISGNKFHLRPAAVVAEEMRAAEDLKARRSTSGLATMFSR